MRKIFFIIILLYVWTGLFAQKVSNPLKKYEISLLDLIVQDSSDFYTTIDNNEFKLGTDFTGATFMNIAKNKGKLYLHPLGTGRLYQVNKNKGEYIISRIDSTIHSGVNFFSKSFFVRDTIYQYGGLGFWSIRGIMTFFSEQTHQWELIQTNKLVPSFFDYNQDAIAHLNPNTPSPKLYISNAYFYQNYPQSFEIAAKDSCFEFDFNTKIWKTLGKINPDLKKILLGKNSLAFDMGKYLIVQSALEFYWINFEENKYGKIKTNYNTEIRQIWLSLYNNEKQIESSNFQFNIGQTIYLCKVTNKKDFEYKTFKFSPEILDLKSSDFIYSNKFNIIYTLSDYFDSYKTLIISIVVITILFISLVYIRNKKKKIPKEVVSILNNNFFSALTIVEKELIEEMYQHNLKGEALSTRLINKIIGVQQKDTLTQNKSRSDYFIRINQKFKLATQHTEPLIIKNRDSADKRQYNYSINPNYIVDIEKLLNN